MSFKGFTNFNCEYYPCHTGIKNEYNCLFCYCPLIAYKCPGPYEVFEDKHGNKRKDCSACKIPHDGYGKSWSIMQKYLDNPIPWKGEEPDTTKHAQQVEFPRENTQLPKKIYNKKIKRGAVVIIKNNTYVWPDVPKPSELAVILSDQEFDVERKVDNKCVAHGYGFGSVLYEGLGPIKTDWKNLY